MPPELLLLLLPELHLGIATLNQLLMLLQRKQPLLHLQGHARQARAGGEVTQGRHGQVWWGRASLARAGVAWWGEQGLLLVLDGWMVFHVSHVIFSPSHGVTCME